MARIKLHITLVQVAAPRDMVPAGFVDAFARACGRSVTTEVVKVGGSDRVNVTVALAPGETWEGVRRGMGVMDGQGPCLPLGVTDPDTGEARDAGAMMEVCRAVRPGMFTLPPLPGGQSGNGKGASNGSKVY